MAASQVIVKQEQLKKLKTMKKKLFVLRDAGEGRPARLEYYDSAKKFASGCPKKSIVLRKCFSITKTCHSHAPYAIILLMLNDSLGMVMDSEEHQDEWLNQLHSLQGVEDSIEGNKYKHTYEHVWDVRVVSATVTKKSVACGPYWMGLAEHTLCLLSKSNETPDVELMFPLVFIRCIRKRGERFEVTLGRHAVTGEGELSMQTEDEYAAQQMHDIVLRKMNAGRENARKISSGRDSQTRQRTKSTSTSDGSKQKRPHSAGTGNNSRNHAEEMGIRTRTVSEGQHQRPQRHISHSPPTNDMLHQRSMDSCGSSLSMDSESGIFSGTPTERMDTHSFLQQNHPDTVLEEDYIDMDHPGELRSPQSYQNLKPTKSMALPIARTNSPVSGSYSLSTSHGSYGSHVGSELHELTSPIGSTPPDVAMSPETVGIRVSRMAPGTPSSRSSLAGSVSHSRTSSLNDDYANMNPLDMSPLTNTISKLRECMSDDSYMEASPGSSCSLTSGTPSMDVSDFPLERVCSYLCPDDEYLAERSNRCYSVGSKPDHLRKQPRLDAIAIAKSAPSTSSRLRAFSVGSRSNSGKGQQNTGKTGDRSPSTNSLAVTTTQSNTGPLSSSWSGSSEKGSFFRNFFKKSEPKPNNLMEVDHSNLKKSNESISSDKLRGSTDSLRKRNRPRSSSRPTNLNPLRKLSVESLNSGRGRSPVKEEMQFGPADEMDYMEVQPQRQPKILEHDTYKDAPDEYLEMQPGGDNQGNNEYMEMAPGQQQSKGQGSDYLPMTPGQQQEGSDYMPMTPGQQQGSSDYLPMTPGQQQGNSHYLPMTPGQQQGSSDYLPMTPGQQQGSSHGIAPRQQGNDYMAMASGQQEEGDDYMAMTPGRQGSSDYVAMTSGQQQKSNDIIMASGQDNDHTGEIPNQQKGDGYMVMTPGKQQGSNDYMDMTPGQQKESNDYMTMAPGNQSKSGLSIPKNQTRTSIESHQKTPDSSYMLMSPAATNPTPPKQDSMAMNLAGQHHRKFSLDNSAEKRNMLQGHNSLERFGSLCGKREHLAIPITSSLNENRDVLKPLGTAFRMKSPLTPDSPQMKHNLQKYYDGSASDEHLNRSLKNGPVFNSFDLTLRNNERYKKPEGLDYFPVAEDSGEYVEVKGSKPNHSSDIPSEYVNMDAKKYKPNSSPFSSRLRKDWISGKIGGSFHSLPLSPRSGSSNSLFSSLPRPGKSKRSSNYKTDSPEMEKSRWFISTSSLNEQPVTKRSPEGMRSAQVKSPLNREQKSVSPKYERYEEGEMCPMDNSTGEMKIIDMETMEEDKRRKSEDLRTMMLSQSSREDRKGNGDNGLRRSASAKSGGWSSSLTNCGPFVPVSVAKKISLTGSSKSNEDSLLKRGVPPNNSSLLKGSPKKTAKQSTKELADNSEKKSPKATDTSPVKGSAFKFSSNKFRLEKQMSVPNGGCGAVDSRARHQSASSTSAALVVAKPFLTSSYSSPSSIKVGCPKSFSSEQICKGSGSSLNVEHLDRLAMGGDQDDEDEGQCTNYIELDHSESNENVVPRGVLSKSRNPSGASICTVTPKEAPLVYSLIDFTRSEEMKGTTTLTMSRHS